MTGCVVTLLFSLLFSSSASTSLAVAFLPLLLRIGPEKYGLGWGGMQGRDGMGRGRGGCLRQALCLGRVGQRSRTQRCKQRSRTWRGCY